MSDFPHVLENLLDSEQAAAIVKVHPKTLQRYARNGLVIGLRVGKLWQFRASDLFSPLINEKDHLDDDDRAQ
jgi:hypothetical protein